MSILLVDDSQPFRNRLRRYLSHEHDLEIVGEASDGVEAVAEIQRLRPDLVLLDLHMPQLDGFAVLREVGRQPSPPAVIVLTGDPNPLLRDRSIALGALAVIDKDRTTTDLLAAIRRFRPGAGSPQAS